MLNCRLAGDFSPGRANIVDEGRLFAESNELHKRLTWIGLKNEQFSEFRGGKQMSPHYLWTLLPVDITFHTSKNWL